MNTIARLEVEIDWLTTVTNKNNAATIQTKSAVWSLKDIRTSVEECKELYHDQQSVLDELLIVIEALLWWISVVDRTSINGECKLPCDSIMIININALELQLRRLIREVILFGDELGEQHEYQR